MKKSEAIAVIQKALEESGDGYYSNTSSDVLEALIKTGILPPPSLATTLGQWDEE
jgi:hypothetical protein